MVNIIKNTKDCKDLRELLLEILYKMEGLKGNNNLLINIIKDKHDCETLRVLSMKTLYKMKGLKENNRLLINIIKDNKDCEPLRVLSMKILYKIGKELDENTIKQILSDKYESIKFRSQIVLILGAAGGTKNASILIHFLNIIKNKDLYKVILYSLIENKRRSYCLCYGG